MELFGQRPEMGFGTGALLHWAEYFVLVGTDENKNNLFGRGDDSDQDKKGVKRTPVVLTRLPEKDVPGYPLPDQVPMVLPFFSLYHFSVFQLFYFLFPEFCFFVS